MNSIKDKKGITFTIIFKAQSLNYGEGMGNVAELKKLSRGNGNVHTFASRQALRYDIVRLGEKMFNWKLDVVDKSKGTVQFKDSCTIKESQEMDLFGYMKTIKGSNSATRSAAVRVSNAISLEDYKGDMEFLSNKGLADRIEEMPNIANVEQHLSFYSYTVTIDLDKIGNDDNNELSSEEKITRINQLLDIIKVLNRDIRGREENLSPLFVIGGMYDINSPFYLGRMQLVSKKDNFAVDTNLLCETSKLTIGDASIYDDTRVGLIKNVFINDSEIEESFAGKVVSVEDFFKDLKEKVKEHYMA